MANAFLSGYEQYLRQDLKYSNSGIYYLRQGGTSPWTAAVSDDLSLANAFERDPKLQVFLGFDYFDLNSPFYAAEFTLAHLQAPDATIARNITTAFFSAGAMAYTDGAALTALHADLSKFIQKAAQ